MQKLLIVLSVTIFTACGTKKEVQCPAVVGNWLLTYIAGDSDCGLTPGFPGSELQDNITIGTNGNGALIISATHDSGVTSAEASTSDDACHLSIQIDGQSDSIQYEMNTEIAIETSDSRFGLNSFGNGTLKRTTVSNGQVCNQNWYATAIHFPWYLY